MTGVASGRPLVLVTVAGVAVAIFVAASLAPLNHNDFMYAVAPAAWAQNGALYTDVPFVQAPLSIMLNAALAAATGDVNIALVGRVVSMLLVLAAICPPLFVGARRGDRVVAILYLALCLTNLFIVFNAAEIGNYAIALLALSAAVTAAEAQGSTFWRGFLVCACAGLATSAKLYFVFLCPALFLYFLLVDRTARNPYVIAACAIGFVAGLSPILFFLLRDYQSFLHWNVQIHQLILPTRVPNLAVGLHRIGKYLATFAVLMAIPLGFMLANMGRDWRIAAAHRAPIIGRLLLLAAAAAMALSPVYVFEQYFAPLAFLLLLFAAPWHSADGKLRRLYVILMSLMLVMQCVVLAQVTARDVMPDGNLGALQLRTLQTNARQIIGPDYACGRKLYSASPLFLLENGVKYPAEMAAGPFLMFLGADPAAKGRAPFDVTRRLEEWSPDIAIWGYYLDSTDPAEAEVDRTIRDYALAHHFDLTPIGQMAGHRIELGTKAGCRRP